MESDGEENGVRLGCLLICDYVEQDRWSACGGLRQLRIRMLWAAHIAQFRC